MWTGMILLCNTLNVNDCITISSQVPYETEELCLASIPAEGIPYGESTYPDFRAVDFLCHQWTYAPANT